MCTPVHTFLLLTLNNITMECYIDYLDCTNRFRQTRKDFKTYQDAFDWMIKNIEKPDIDMIKYY